MESKAKQLIHMIFDVNNPFMLASEKVLNLFMLNLFFVISCLPILTIGPAKIALHTCLQNLGHGQRAGFLRTYTNAFRENLVQGGVLGIIELLLIVFSLLDLYLLSFQKGFLFQILQSIFIGILFLTILIFSYVYPLVSRRILSTKEALKTSLLLAGLNLPWSILIVLVWVGLALLLTMNALTLMMGLSALFLFGFAGLTYLQTIIMDIIFKKYN